MDLDRPHDEPPAHRDCRTRLLVLGALLVLFGCGAFLVGGFTLLSVLAAGRFAPEAHLRPVQVLPSLIFYVTAAVLLITLGIGSIRCRRWARPFILILGWAWLGLGVLTLVVFFVLLPRILETTPSVDPRTAHWTLGCMGVVQVLLGILMPLLLILLYRGPDVRATFAARDPSPRWTDRVPTPLLGLSLWMGTAALGTLFSSAYAVFPAGPVLLSGPPAVAVSLALGALWTYLAIGLARRSRAAWWVALATTLATAPWALFAFPRTDFEALRRAMGLVQQPGIPDVIAMYQAPWFLAAMGILWASMLGYLLYVRRFLRE